MKTNCSKRSADFSNLKYCFSVALMLWLGISQAQFYPVPPRVDPVRKKTLLMQINARRYDENEVTALLQLSCIYYHYPLKKRSDLDQALLFATEAETLSIHLHDTAGINNARFYKGEAFIAERNMAAAEQLLDQVDDTTRLKLFLNLSDYNDFNSNTLLGYAAKAADFARKALTLATRLGRKAEENDAWLNIANVEMGTGSLADCENTMKKIFADTSNKQYQLLRYAYIFYSSLHSYKGNNDKMLYYSLKALGTIDNPADSLQAGDCYMAQALSHHSFEDNDRSFYFSKKAIEAYSVTAGEASIADAINYGTIALTREKHYDQAKNFLSEMDTRYPPVNESEKNIYLNAWGYLYKGEKKYAQAEPYYLQNLKMAEASHQVDESVYRNFGDLLVQDHKYAQARPYLIKALNFPGANTSLHVKALVQYYLFLCDSAAGDYRLAIRELSLAGNFNNEINNLNKIQQVRRLEAQFETEEKEKELKIKDQDIQLLQRTNQVQQADLARSQLVKKGTIAGIIILGALLIVSVGYYRQKQKANQLVIRNNQTITKKNEQLEQLLIDKDWLLKEVNHRVKNNLHTVICLLESQAAFLQNDALAAIESSQHRIYAMSLIHQKLYQSTDVRAVNMSNYLSEFVMYLKESFGSPRHINFQQEIESIDLEVSQAIPLALIVNEAVTNAIKYAFPDAGPGEITIRLREQDNAIRLIIQDNGIGMPGDTDANEVNSLGLSLIKGLTDDLRGDVQFVIDHGTSVIVSFERVPIIFRYELGVDPALRLRK